MASRQGSQLDAAASAASGLAKPLYLQRLERSLKLDSFLNQTSAIFKTDITRYRRAEGGEMYTFFYKNFSSLFGLQTSEMFYRLI